MVHVVLLLDIFSKERPIDIVRDGKYFEMLSKFRNIGPNHIILLNINQYWGMLYDVLNMWPMI